MGFSKISGGNDIDKRNNVCVRGSPMVLYHWLVTFSPFVPIQLPVIPLVEKLVQMVKMVMPLVPLVQMLPTNGTNGRTPNTRNERDILSSYYYLRSAWRMIA